MHEVSDTLLAWMSELQDGTIPNFRRRATWLADTTRQQTRTIQPNSWLRNLSILGHCDLDWRTSRWKMIEAGVTEVPFSDGLAVLYGSRRRQLLNAMDDAGVYIERTLRVQEHSYDFSPTTIYLPYSTSQELIDLARNFGLQYYPCAAEQILASTSTAESFEPAAPPTGDSLVERFQFTDSVLWTRHIGAHLRPEDGLYREQLYGRWKYLAFHGGRWWSVDRDIGVFWMLSSLGRTVLQFNVERGRGGSVGALITKNGVTLPTSYARSLVFCSGLLPRFARVPGAMLFENVPRTIAETVAENLGQDLQVREHS